MKRARRVALVGVVSIALVCINASPAFAPPGGGGGSGGGSGTAASFVDYAQCANGAPPSASLACPQGWINGILQGSNSHYSEDQVTPQRLTLEVPAGSPSTGRKVVISYMTRKGSAPAHAYDSLATWNYTQTQADRCQGLTISGKNPTCALPNAAKVFVTASLDPCTGTNTPCRFQMASDPTSVPPPTGIDSVTSGHELPAPDRQWAIFGGSITASSTPTHDSAADPTTDDFATVEVTYSVPDTTPANGVDKATKVQFLFGGHLAASDGPRGWGAGLGAANISGGPYHIKLQTADGASLGSKDNQIQSSAILAGSPNFTVVKTNNSPTAEPDAIVEYTVTVTNTGSAPGATSFVDDYDNRLTILTVPFGCQNGAGQLTCTTSTISNVAPNNTQPFVYTARLPSTFTGSPGGSTFCLPTQFPVINNVRLANGQTDDSVVCVNASPTFTVVKTASATFANPDQLVTYTIVVSNGGTATGSTSFTDDYDDRIQNVSAVTSSPAGGSCTPGTVNGTAGFNCQSGDISPGGSRTFTYTANMPASFTGNPGGHNCSSTPPNTQYSVRNVVVLANGQNDDAVVCVNAAPDFDVTKTVVSPTGNPPTTTPGGTVRYRLTATNNGTAAGSGLARDTYDARVTISGLPGACSNNTTTHVVTCDTGTLNPGGGSISFEYNATMPTTFTGPSGGSDCPTGTYPIINTVVITGGASDDAVVCVDAKPNLTLAKSATVNPNGTVTYTLTYRNTGPAAASGVSIVEDIPTGTAFAGCTGGCTTSGSPITRATWNIGAVAPNSGPVSVTLTVTVTATNACQICNTARIASPDFNNGNPVNSNQVCLEVTPQPNPAGAHASGDSLGAKVVTRGLIGIETTDLSKSETSQTGVGGPQLDDDVVLTASLPGGGSILTANVLKTTSASVVTASPAEARSTDVAEVAGLCILPTILGCTVSSSTVRAVASATATGSSASHSDAGSTIENLRIAGILTPVDLNVPLTVQLNPLLFGAGSYVAINERQSSVTTPAAGQTSGGTYAADLTVTMIHVHVTGLLGLQSIDVTVAKAHAHADFPQTTVCGGVKQQAVSGHAFVASLFTAIPLANLVQGLSGPLPGSGGSDEAHIVDLKVPSTGSVVTAKAADSSTVGTLTATQSKADSIAEVAGNQANPACLLRTSTSTCLVSATAVHTESHSLANASGATSNDSGTVLTNVKVLGLTVAANPAPNTVIPILGLGFIILNEQFCDNGAKANHSCAGADHSGLTVRAARIVVLPGNNYNMRPGVEVIVAEAHSDARFVG